MSLLWPSLFYGIGLLPLILLVYIWGLHRRSRYAARMSSLSLVREAAGSQSQWRRHLPFGFFLMAITSLIVAVCRPVMMINVPSKQGLILLALDVSRSMCSTDIQPTRLQALETTVSQFVARQSPTTKIGVVAFSDSAEVIQPPTNDKTAVDQAILSLMTGWNRAIGAGIYKSLDVIAREEGQRWSDQTALTPIPPGGYAPAIIILVTNGFNNTGPSPLGAARLAAERGIRIYTIGISSPSGTVNTSCQSSDPSGFGGEYKHDVIGTSGVDTKTMKQIAALTGARYYPALGLSGLRNVFRDSQLPRSMVKENFEVTVVFVALGVLFAMISYLMTLFWSRVF